MAQEFDVTNDAAAADILFGKVPSVRPLNLTALIEKGFNLLESKDIDFRYQKNVTPLSSYPEMAVSVVLYLAVIFSLQKFMASRKPFAVKKLLGLHSWFLSITSCILLVLLCQAIIPQILNNGLFYTVCSVHMFDDRRLEYYYYINYLFKFYELVDTVFLVLQKKKLEFLHVYHHALTLVLCGSQLYGNTTVQWVPIMINLFVHVVMYYYFAQTAFGKRVWWKKYVTVLQIAQFIIDVVAVYFALWVGLAKKRGIPGPAHWGGCHGSEKAGYFGAALISSYLFLFIEFFRKTYSAAAAAARVCGQPSSSKKKAQ